MRLVLADVYKTVYHYDTITVFLKPCFSLKRVKKWGDCGWNRNCII